jgi:hypothetical protein
VSQDQCEEVSQGVQGDESMAPEGTLRYETKRLVVNLEGEAERSLSVLWYQW